MEVSKPKQSSDPLALTIPQAGEQLAVSRSTIRRLLSRGDLKQIKIGRAVRVLASSVDELAARGGIPRA